MEIIDSFLLGLIQGLTEFLPISSSGHLVLGKALLAETGDKSITFEVVVHFGTLCSIVVYYHKELSSIISSLWGLGANPSEFSERMNNDTNVKLAGFILLSMIPAMIVGFTLKEVIENIFLNPFMVSIMLIVTGILLYTTKLRESFQNHLNAGSAFAIGMAQAFAILPGISRSGSTISLGLYLGIKREEVANFSFLMVIPVIAGAMMMEVREMVELGISNSDLVSLGIGFLTAFVSGYFALKYLIILLRTKGIYPFAWYCWLLGITGLIWYW